MKPSLIVAAAALAASGQAAAQSIADQKTQWEVAKLAAETQKTRAEANNIVTGMIRNTTGGTATVENPEKTAEVLMLTKASLAGAAARLAAALGATKFKAADTVRPLIVMGRNPPSTAQWLAFERRRGEVGNLLNAAANRWREAQAEKSLAGGAVMGVVTLVSAIVPMLKTDTTITGGTVDTNEDDVRAALGVALDRAGYGPDPDLAAIDGEKATKDLLEPVARRYDAIWRNYTNALPTQPESEKMKAAATAMQAAITAYRELEAELVTEAGGVMAAVAIERQRLRHERRATTPVIHILNADTAFSLTTKKGIFTGLGGSVPSFASAATVLDYAIVGPDVQHVGSAGCTIAKRPVAELLTFQTATLPDTAATLCPLPVAPPPA